jgi:hypothetical protein
LPWTTTGNRFARKSKLLRLSGPLSSPSPFVPQLDEVGTLSVLELLPSCHSRPLSYQFLSLRLAQKIGRPSGARQYLNADAGHGCKDGWVGEFAAILIEKPTDLFPLTGNDIFGALSIFTTKRTLTATGVVAALMAWKSRSLRSWLLSVTEKSDCGRSGIGWPSLSEASTSRVKRSGFRGSGMDACP